MPTPDVDIWSKDSQNDNHKTTKCNQATRQSSADNGALDWTGEDFRNIGNKLCSLNRYEEAKYYYTKAISKNPHVAAFYSNRALCYLRAEQWLAAVYDCEQAIELDPNLVRAHFFLGRALTELANYDDALKHLQIAHELAKTNNLNFGDDITSQIRLVKRLKWNKVDADLDKREQELRDYLIDLIDKDKKRKLDMLQQTKTMTHQQDPGRAQSSTMTLSSTTNVGFQTEPQPSTSSSPLSSPPQQVLQSSLSSTTIAKPCSSSHLSQSQPSLKLLQQDNTANDVTKLSSHGLDGEDGQQTTSTIAVLQDHVNKCDLYNSQLEALFDHMKLERSKREVPEYLCGKISFEIMQDPVITPSGITYDRSDIDEHLKRVGHFDPISRKPLGYSQLVPNLAMKEVVDAYLKDNEWARYT